MPRAADAASSNTIANSNPHFPLADISFPFHARRREIVPGQRS